MKDERLSELLAASGITLEAGEYAGVHLTRGHSDIPSTGQGLMAVFPYYTMTGRQMYDDRGGAFFRARILEESWKGPKYMQARGSGVRAYFPRVEGLRWDDIRDAPDVDIMITEGEKKALCVSSLGMACIGLGGVNSFSSRRGGGFLADLQQINWLSRVVFVVYDNDVHENQNVQTAELRLAEVLVSYGADVRLARIPRQPDGTKIGVDDLYVQSGTKALVEVLRHAERPDSVSREVLKVNTKVAFVASENKIWNYDGEYWATKDSFVQGSVFSSRRVVRRTSKGLVEASLAKLWLTHPLSKRYDKLAFDPTTEQDTVIEGESCVCLNLFPGLPKRVKGNPTPFIALTDVVFAGLPSENMRKFLLHLLIWRIQNLDKQRPPIAGMLIGSAEGTGKSLWCDLVGKAFGDTYKMISNATLASQYNGFLERSLLVCVDEVDAKTMKASADNVKTYSAANKLVLNEKFRHAASFALRTTMLYTTNSYSAAAFSYDDRRNFVVDVERSDDNQGIISAAAKFAQHPDCSGIMRDYFESYDLGSWEPPARAPMTAAKWNAYRDSLDDVQLVAMVIRETRGLNIIMEWLNEAMAWAASVLSSGISSDEARGLASSLRTSIDHYPVRHFYTASELRVLLPGICEALTGGRSPGKSRRNALQSPGILAERLRQEGVRYLANPQEPRGFLRKGRYEAYLVVSEVETYRSMTQEQFDDYMADVKTYGEMKDA